MSNNCATKYLKHTEFEIQFSEGFHNGIDQYKNISRSKSCIVSNGFSFTPKRSM